jgi:hypothetical protein
MNYEGWQLAELLCSMDMEPPTLAPSWPRLYPTNYFWQVSYRAREFYTHESTCSHE